MNVKTTVKGFSVVRTEGTASGLDVHARLLRNLPVELFVNPLAAWAINRAARHFKLNDLGHIEKVSIDVTTKTIHLKVKLNGEDEAVEIIVEGYSIVHNGESQELKFKNIKMSRPWMQRAADLWMPKSLPLSPWIAGVLRVIL